MKKGIFLKVHKIYICKRKENNFVSEQLFSQSVSN